MNFRIRNPDGNDYTERQKAYCRHVDVVADEPTAFALLEADPRFHVPTWSEERMSG